MTKPPQFLTGTPISNSTRTRDQASLFSEPKREDLTERRRKFADDMAHAAVPADKDEFCKAFFPAPTDPAVLEQKPKLTENPFAALLEANKLLEADVRRLFTKAVNDHNLVPGFKMRECGERPDPSSLDGDKQKVDAALYHAEHAPTDGRQAWPDQMIPIEFKRDDNNLDPWDDSKPNISTEALKRKEGRGQCISYSELLHAVQHRVALFMLVVVGTRARFVRWDRSGTIVTRAFNYVQDWEFFCDILWRISLCSDSQLGLDPTATRLRPGDADYDRMTAAADLDAHTDDVDEKEHDLKPNELPADGFVYKYVRKMFSESVLSPWPRYRVEVPVSKDDKDDKDSEATRHFLIAKPTFRARGMSGRGTRGYVALDCKTGDFVWLKDAWRAHYLLVDKEGDVLRRLNNAEVMNVPTLICHGDIQDQVTLTPDWWEIKNPLPSSKPAPDSSPSLRSSLSGASTITSSSSASRKRKCGDERSEDSVPPPKGLSTGLVGFRKDCPLRLHKHYRLVEKEVGMPLSNFQHGRQLVSVVLDSIYAHFEAATKPEVPLLHRDVSGGNILIVPHILKDADGAEIKWRGMLTDWEMSKPMDSKNTSGRQPERTGTWQFLSVALLSRPKEVEICDELEAFFYVILYYGVRYLRSNVETVGNWISSFFDTYGVRGDTYICGNEKLSAIKTGILTVSGTNTDDNTSVQFDSPLDGVITELLRWFKAHFVWTQYERRKERLKKTILQLRPQASLGAAPLRRGRDNPYPARARDTVLPLPQPPHLQDSRPSAEDEALHKYVLTHDEMMDLLVGALASYDWTGDDKVGDRVGSGYRPPAQEVGPTLPVSLATNKRRKVEDEPQFAASLPILPLASGLPPKTPERKKTGGPHHTTGYRR
ncbi:hypothetical protein GSI_05162 [Ganoderma sinense ZZ0214-1]|uniref:Fungal-type protein kinase domain-containing protein n=1 Tax=Ganoderma sinense ZZ0214-1 TaxID=1077348 RepID=A0A2G8SFB5_9APHY|nr:hypothetical protein GSI_05162 [Ganoderma sinense ZZ0214-1]